MNNKDSTISPDTQCKEIDCDDGEVTNSVDGSKESPLLRLLGGDGGGEATDVKGNDKDVNDKDQRPEGDVEDTVAKDDTDVVAKEDAEDVLEEEEQRKVFADVFSDSDSEEEER